MVGFVIRGFRAVSHWRTFVIQQIRPIKYGFADYLLYVDGLPEALPVWERPLPFAYQSTGVESRFTNGLDPEPCSRHVFSFHRPEWIAAIWPIRH